jgi:flagellar biosynthesis/type III secretory pathway M-ring protein FliF/YscJ
MKYLSLNNEELKELINLKKGSFIGFGLVIGLVSIVSYFVSDYILPDNSISPLAIVVLLILSFAFVFVYSNREYLQELQKKQKKVYRGVLSHKSAKDERYQFNMDGNIFLVDKDTYENFAEGDIVEFHISSFIKHLYKVEKVTERD